MDFGYYKGEPVQLALDLVNSFDPVSGSDELRDTAGFERLLSRHKHPDLPVTPQELAAVRGYRAALRQVFETTDAREAAARLNELLLATGAVPRVTGHDESDLHMHFEPLEAGIAAWVGAVAAMALAVVLCEHGVERLGVCSAASCKDVYVDTSKNRSKRYCSEGCAHRASVAAFRARRRART